VILQTPFFFIIAVHSFQMVLLVGGTRVEEVPVDSRALYALPGLKESAAQLASTLPKQIGSVGVLYVSQREFAVVSPHDSKAMIRV